MQGGLCGKSWESSAFKFELFLFKLTVKIPRIINILNFIKVIILWLAIVGGVQESTKFRAFYFQI
jgi:hypothetical protein